MDTSLPSDKTASVGESAIFTCRVAVERNAALIASVEIEYIPSIGEAPDIVCTSGFKCECISESCPVEINTKKNSTFNVVQYTYDITIPDVTDADSGGTVSCALRYKDDIQWKRQAWLNVTPITVTATPSVSPVTDGDTLNKLPYIATAPSLLVILLVAVIVLLIIIWSRKRKIEKRRTGASDTGMPIQPWKEFRVITVGFQGMPLTRSNNIRCTCTINGLNYYACIRISCASPSQFL